MNVKGKTRRIGQVDPERKGNSKKSKDSSAMETKQPKARVQSGEAITDGFYNPKRGGEANQAKRGIPNGKS